MIIGDRLRQLREERKLSQGDIEKRTGLLRCYISRVENGHTVPAVETLEKLARAMGVQLYQLFQDTTEVPAKGMKSITAKGPSRVDDVLTSKLNKLRGTDRRLLLKLVDRMTRQPVKKVA
jgi:transcriptional regulator with XRE-family HTH domain